MKRTRRPVGVIDLGSNSARIVVFRLDPGGDLEVVADEHASARLIRELDSHRRINRSALERTLRLLRDFRAVAQGAGAREIIVLGTAALREAVNARALVARARDEIGLEVRILGAEAEARAGFLGAVYSLPVRHGLVFDIGGGSLQVSRFRDRKIRRSWSLPLGALRVSDTFLTSDPPGKGQIRRLRAHVLRALSRAGVPALAPDESLIGTGGTVRNLAKIDSRRREYPIQRLHGYELTRAHLRELMALLTGIKVSARASVPGLNPDRADSIAGGGVTAECMMDACGGTRFLVTGFGLREGIALSTLGAALPSPEDVRVGSIASLTANFNTCIPARSRRRSDLALALYKILEPHPEPFFRELMAHAAAVLDIGRSVDYYRLHAHTALVIRASGLFGFSHREIAQLSSLVELADRNGWNLKRCRPLLHEDDHAPLERAGLVLALADAIEQRLPPRRRAKVSGRVRSGEFVLDEPALDAWEGLEFRKRFRKEFGLELRTASG